ncbi:hypothetical protein B5X24_HaOG205491 [Helicoverpa armigera]|nr:hypothetical protein B5X24_HaOG205491 [Helicoverpa armigera]
MVASRRFTVLIVTAHAFKVPSYSNTRPDLFSTRKLVTETSCQLRVYLKLLKLPAMNFISEIKCLDLSEHADFVRSKTKFMLIEIVSNVPQSVLTGSRQLKLLNEGLASLQLY